MKEKFILWFVWKLPSWLIYWSAIRLIGDATTGDYGNTNPNDLNVMEALKRWSNLHGDY